MAASRTLPFMTQSARIYVAGHRGLVGSAIEKILRAQGYDNIVCRTHAELDLLDSIAVECFLSAEKPGFVCLAAARVG